MNQIHTLLTRVVETAQLPSADEIRDVVDRGSSVAEKVDARKQIERAAKRIIGALDAGMADKARQHAEDTADSLGHMTSDGGDDATPRALAERITASQPQDQDRRPSSAPVKSLLLAGLRLGGARPSDLDDLVTRRDASEDEVAKWRERVIEASREVSRVYQSGNQGAARRLAAEHAVGLADMLAPAERVDPAAGIDDPRELARLIHRGPHDAA